jgi:hypothetical protein
VYDHNVGPVADTVTCRFNSAAEIYFLVIQKEGFVEDANLLQDGSPDDGEGSRHPVRLGLIHWVGPSAIGPSPETRFAKSMRQTSQRQEVIED